MNELILTMVVAIWLISIYFYKPIQIYIIYIIYILHKIIEQRHRST